MDLEMEVEAMRMILFNLEKNVAKAVECVTQSFDKLMNTSIEGKFKQIYQDVMMDLEGVDKWMTVLCSPIANNQPAL